MEKRRIEIDGEEITVTSIPEGNTFRVTAKPKVNGEYVDFSDVTDLSVKMQNVCERKTIPASSVVWSDNQVSFIVRGEYQHKKAGLYDIIITYSKPNTPVSDLRTIGFPGFLITPVGTSGKDSGCCPDVDVPELKFEVEVSIGASGTTDHRELSEESRFSPDQHTIGSISGLREELDDRITSEKLNAELDPIHEGISENAAQIVRMQENVEQNAQSISDNATAISDEERRATSAEDALTQKIADNTSAITTETQARTNADNELSQRIDTNVAEIADVKSDLVEVREIAEGATGALVFDTKDQLDEWLAGTYTRPDGKTPASLKVGQHLLLEEVDVPDYWWTGTGISPLETDKVDLSDYYDKEQADIKFATKAALESEMARATGAESEIKTSVTQNAQAITAERERAMGVESELSEKIDENKTAIENEVTRATQSESALDTKITAEAQRAQQAEAALDAKIGGGGGSTIYALDLSQGDQVVPIPELGIELLVSYHSLNARSTSGEPVLLNQQSLLMSRSSISLDDWMMQAYLHGETVYNNWGSILQNSSNRLVMTFVSQAYLSKDIWEVTFLPLSFSDIRVIVKKL